MTSPQGQDQVSASLLGCPLCGGSQIGGPYTDEREGMVYFACISRPGEPCAQVYGRTPDGARERWNTRRAPPPAVSEVREEQVQAAAKAINESPLTETFASADPWMGLARRVLEVALPLPRMGEGISLSQSQPSGDASALPADDWTQWNGGENPAPGKWVDVKYRNGEIDIDCRSSFVDWSHPWNAYGEPDPGYDIIAYRIIPTDAGKEGA